VTRYGVDEARGELIAMWETGRGAVASAVRVLPAGLDARQRMGLAAELTGLSKALWRCYTHPASAANGFEINSQGWRREKTRAEFANVVRHVRRPNLIADDDGTLIVEYDAVAECANRVGRALHAAGDAELTKGVVAEIEAELEAVARAELGDLFGPGSAGSEAHPPGLLAGPGGCGG
jgi:hypothetical protein